MNNVDFNMLEGWKNKPASETFEFMEAVTINEGMVDRVCRVITAFLNTSGGLIVVDLPKDDSFWDLGNRVQMAIDSDIAPRPNVEVTLANVGYSPEKHVFIADVPVGYERPYSHKSQILLRKETSIQLASRNEILKLIGEHEDPDIRWERQVLPGASETELDQERIYECLKREEISIAMRNSKAIAEDSDTWSFLRYFHLGRRPLLRNSSIVLFGKNPTMFFPQIAIRAVAYDTEESDAPEIRDEKTFSRNLFANIEECLFFCERHTSFTSKFPSSDDKTFQRSEKYGYPFSAIREAILNALVHRDFSSFDTLVSIKIMPSRIEIWNPGSFPAGTNLDRLEDFRVSRPTNPDIAHVLQRTGFIERLGSGINRIIKQFEAHKLPRPMWEEVGGGIRVTLSLSTESQAKIKKSAEFLISKLEDGEVLSLKRLASIGNTDPDQIRAIIEFLCDKSILRPLEDGNFKVRLKSKDHS
jgi:ATP-dependent DNA helicase RecG